MQFDQAGAPVQRRTRNHPKHSPAPLHRSMAGLGCVEVGVVVGSATVDEDDVAAVGSATADEDAVAAVATACESAP